MGGSFHRQSLGALSMKGGEEMLIQYLRQKKERDYKIFIKAIIIEKEFIKYISEEFQQKFLFPDGALVAFQSIFPLFFDILKVLPYSIKVHKQFPPSLVKGISKIVKDSKRKSQIRYYFILFNYHFNLFIRVENGIIHFFDEKEKISKIIENLYRASFGEIAIVDITDKIADEIRNGKELSTGDIFDDDKILTKCDSCGLTIPKLDEVYPIYVFNDPFSDEEEIIGYACSESCRDNLEGQYVSYCSSCGRTFSSDDYTSMVYTNRTQETLCERCYIDMMLQEGTRIEDILYKVGKNYENHYLQDIFIPFSKISYKATKYTQEELEKEKFRLVGKFIIPKVEFDIDTDKTRKEIVDNLTEIFKHHNLSMETPVVMILDTEYNSDVVIEVYYK